MPIYEYCCESCNHRFEYLVLGQDCPESCPKCGAATLCRLMSACGFHSKGQGGETVKASAGASSCSGCSSSSCAGCGH